MLRYGENLRRLRRLNYEGILSLQSRLDVTKEEIFEAFNNLVRDNKVFERFKFCFFIDGLDELDEGKDTTHLQIARLLHEWTDTAKAFVKVCVSSRPFPVFEDMPVDHRIQLQDLTKYDMTSFVHHTLRSVRAFRVKMRSNSPDCQRLIKAIVDGSDGVFLWVSLVAKSVSRGLSNEDSVTVLLERIGTTPRKLETLFQSLLEIIEDCHAQMALILLVVTMGFQTRSEDLIISDPVCRQFFRARETSPRGSIDTVLHPNNPLETFDWTREEARRTKSRLAFRCKGLLEIVRRPNGTTWHCDDGGWVTLIHRSIPEFLVKWVPEHMRAQGVTCDHINNARCWMLWAKIRFETSTRNLEHISVDEACSRSSISKMATAAVSKLWGPNLSTSFQLLDLSEDALLSALVLSGDHARGNDGNLEGLTRKSVCFTSSDHSTFHEWCPFFASPLVAAARMGFHRYLLWRLPRMRRVYAPCGDNIQHYLQAAFDLLPCLNPPIKARILDWMQVVQILINVAGANVNGTFLRCCRIPLADFDKAGKLPSIFDAAWIIALFNPSYFTSGFRNDLFSMIQFLLELGATPQSFRCVSAANGWFRISSLQPGSPDGIQLGNAEEISGISYRPLIDKATHERLRMDDGIITLEKWVKHAKPENMMAILQLVEVNTSAKAKVVDLKELPPTGHTRVAALGNHGLHRGDKMI